MMTKRVALSHCYSRPLFDKISNNYLARGSINELEFTFAAVILTNLLNLYLPLALNWASFGMKEQLSLTLNIASLMAISQCEPPTTPSVITLERKWHEQRMNKTRKLFFFLTKRLNERLILSRFAIIRGTQRQFSENISSEDDLRSKIFGTFVVKFLACLPLLGFSNI